MMYYVSRYLSLEKKPFSSLQEAFDFAFIEFEYYGLHTPENYEALRRVRLGIGDEPIAVPYVWYAKKIAKLYKNQDFHKIPIHCAKWDKIAEKVRMERARQHWAEVDAYWRKKDEEKAQRKLAPAGK